MKINDKTRYNTSNPDVDWLSLGKNPELSPLDRQYVRQALSFLHKDSVTDRERAAKFLLKRIQQYYDVIGYVGPIISSAKSEIGYCLGGWINEHGHAPWRESFCTTNNYSWEKPEKIFNSVRYACFESALRLAAWEVEQEVPESAETLKRARWLAYGAIQEHTDRRWYDIRNRMGTTGMKKQLKSVIDKVNLYRLVTSKGEWLGHFEPIT